ncbi:MAG: FKBP-type peptidyl-prolyl cis-trans isomerase [Actinomycetaceae bacterium]|nr:FKBP-type peptidyl-prolyl cis-trans isomerase [Actinomycetaceae bacterium]
MINATIVKFSRVLAVLAVFAFIAVFVTGCGSAQNSASGGFPEVTGAANKEPNIGKGTQGKEPKETISRVLASGKGKKIGEKDTVLVNYKGQLWNGTKFDSSWDKGRTATAFGLNQVVKGWQIGLAGKHVGDRVQIVIPPKDGYGDQNAGSIPPNSTLVFVVDVKDSANMDDSAALKKAKPLNPQLPQGVTVAGATGTEPKLAVADTFKMPSEQTITVINEGEGKPLGPDDFCSFHIVAKIHGKQPPGGGPSEFSSWKQNQVQRTPNPIGANKIFLGQKLGSRILLQLPAAGDQPGQVAVIDIVGALASK